MKTFIKDILFGLQVLIGCACIVYDFCMAYTVFKAMLTATGLNALGLLFFSLLFVAMGVWWLWEIGNLRPSKRKAKEEHNV